LPLMPFSRASSMDTQRSIPRLCTTTISGSSGDAKGSRTSAANCSTSSSIRLLVKMCRPAMGVYSLICDASEGRAIRPGSLPAVVALVFQVDDVVVGRWLRPGGAGRALADERVQGPAHRTDHERSEDGGPEAGYVKATDEA